MRKYNSGQALVLVLLSLSVVLTLVLYILSRSITDISTSTRDEDSVRAFSAAEAGVERALVIGQSIGNSELNNSSYSASVTSASEGSSTYNYPIDLYSGETGTIWYVAHDSDGNKICSMAKPCYAGNTMKFCWGKNGTSSNSATTPAIEISIFYENKIARAVLDPNSARRVSNNFSQANTSGCQIDNKDYQFWENINFPSLGINRANDPGVLQFARVRFLYNTDEKHSLGVTSNGILPSQGMLINSSGVSGESNRRLEVFQGWPEPPSILDYAIFSSTGLSK